VTAASEPSERSAGEAPVAGRAESAPGAGRGDGPTAAEGAGRTLILGANGNVGSLLLRELVRRGLPVLGALRPGRVPPPEPAAATWAVVELTLPETLSAAAARAEVVVWTPSIGLVPHCLQALERAAPRRVVFVSSASVHTSLASRGARTKRAAEAAIRASSLDFTIIRPTMIYGNARDRNISRLLDYLERFRVFPLFGEGTGLMQPIFIEDLVEAIARAAESPAAPGATYDIGGKSPLTYRGLVEAAAAALGRRVRFLRVPIGLAAGSLRLANRLGLRFLREEQVHRLTEDKIVDNSRVMAELGVAPRSFVEGIAEQVRSRRTTKRPREA
jgi:uncharacterized protein YbjT (DUF2867 family)